MAEPAAEAPASRPAVVPPDAHWNEPEALWEAGPRDEQGRRQGPYRAWAVDGHLALECVYRDDLRHGPFRRYHHTGELAREGTYVDGKLDGVVTAYASDARGTQPLRRCCVPPGARQMAARFDAGRMLRERFLDGDGRALLSTGALRPERPAAVPENAEFEERARRWAAGELERDSLHRHGLWSWWSEDGVLLETVDYDRGRRRQLRRFAPDGQVLEELSLDGESTLRDRAHGAVVRRYQPGESGHADPRVRSVEGSYDHGQPVGRWAFRDDGGHVLFEADWGVAFGPSDDPRLRTGALADVDAEASHWTALADALLQEGRAREALLAAARAVARSGDPAPLRTRLQALVYPLTPERAEAEAQKAAELCGRAGKSEFEGGTGEGESPLPPLLDGLLLGAEPALPLRLMAAALTGAPRAARDLADAAVHLAPARTDVYVTRALVRLDLADLEGARADIAQVRAHGAEETATFLGTYLGAVFPTWDFWPAREALAPLPEDGVEAAALLNDITPAQPLAAVRATLAVYATRIARVREALRDITGAPPDAAWLPPDLSHLLPTGPVALRHETATIEDQADDGTPELTEVTVDETLTLDGLAVPALLRLARASYGALAWLCWCTGRDGLAYPERLAPQPLYAQALATVMARAFRAQDGLLTGGLRSLTLGVPGFVWEGTDIEELPRALLEICAAEYMERRAALLWLSNPGNLSPFQSDLRRV